MDDQGGLRLDFNRLKSHVGAELLGSPAMFIQTEATPNPDVLKFIPGCPVMKLGTREFLNADQGKASPLAEALLGIDGVETVFFGPDFITVRKDRKSPVVWAQIKAPILAAIMDHFTASQPLMRDAAAPKAGLEDSEASQIILEIKDLLDTRVRPAVAQDGGDIEFDRFEAESGTLYLHMRGACSGCPSSSQTLKQGVASLMAHYIPEVKAVEASL